jgi:hypothetical protein
MTIHHAGSLRARRLLPGAAVAAAILLAACGGASGAAYVPTPAATVAAVSPSPAGPASWADWIDHQGFGAQNGPNEVRRRTRYVTEHAGAENLFDLDDDIATVSGIVTWLDAHPATACWAAYHTQVQAYLVAVRDGLIAARPEVEAGRLIPADIVASTDEAANAANELPAPASCP